MAHIGIFVGIATCDIPVFDNILSNVFHTGFCYRGNCAVNSTVFYLCDVTGLDIFDGSAGITCVGNNTWFPPLGTCVPGEFNTFQLPKVAKGSIHTCDYLGVNYCVNYLHNYRLHCNCNSLENCRRECTYLVQCNPLLCK